MFRSAPFEKIEVKKEETINNEEEEDKKYFIEWKFIYRYIYIYLCINNSNIWLFIEFNL